jgi:hypothetical protein
LVRSALSTETVAIIVPGVVAVAAIAATWHQHLRGLGHERQLVDLDNVRDILDEAAVALHVAAYALDNVRGYLDQYGGVRFFKTDDGSDTYKLLGSHGKELDALVERLSVRLGRDCDVVVAFRRPTKPSSASGERQVSCWLSLMTTGVAARQARYES